MYEPKITCKINPEKEDVKITFYAQNEYRDKDSFYLNPEEREILKKLIASYFSDDSYKVVVKYSSMLDCITVGWDGPNPYIVVGHYYDAHVDELLESLEHIIKVVEVHQTAWKQDNTPNA